MKFGKIEHIIIFGGSRLTAELSAHLQKNTSYSFHVFTCERQLADIIYSDDTTLRKFFVDREIPFCSTENINENEEIKSLIMENSLGLGLGEAWSFSAELISRFQGRLLDFMGIRLPQYRGGAHYTWQILRGNRIGCCNLQIINEKMVQGVFDSGEIIKTEEYLFPPSARIPADYFDYAVKKEILFLNEFLEEVDAGKDFELSKVQENFSIYFPRLNTLRHGFINWEWDTKDIERFICSFDDPYAGASTFINGERVHLKKCHSESNDGPFHPFQTGLIYKNNAQAIFVATRSGTLIIRDILSCSRENIIHYLKPGQRFFTPKEALEDAFQFNADYSEAVLKGATEYSTEGLIK